MYLLITFLVLFALFIVFGVLPANTRSRTKEELDDEYTEQWKSFNQAAKEAHRETIQERKKVRAAMEYLNRNEDPEFK